MSSTAAAVELEPLENQSLLGRFAGIRAAMDAEEMAQALQTALFEQSGLVVESCERPRAEVQGDGTCWLQYPLTLRGSEAVLPAMVIGTMFGSLQQALAFERSRLAPLAAAAGGAQTGKRTAVVAPLRLAVSIFPVHGALPTLIGAMDTQRVSAVLASVLAERPRVHDAALVGLRRTRGCVLRYRVDSDEHAVVYGKVGETADGESVQRGLGALAAEAAGRAATVFYPRALGHSEELDLTLVADVPGARPDLALKEERDRAVEAAAEIAAYLHGSRVSTGAVRTFEHELERAVSAVRTVSRDAPELARRLAQILRAAEDLSKQSRRQDRRLAHGSFAPSQLMLDGSRVGVLDFDRLCDAEPALDLGRFLAPLRVTLAKRHSADGDEAASMFLRRYQAFGGAIGSEERVALYEIVALVRMAARSWLQLKRSRLHVVSAVLESRAVELGLR